MTHPAPSAVPAAAPARLYLVAMLLCGAALVMTLAVSLWSDSVDLAHHYALVMRISELWQLPEAANDPSLGEMNIYPRGAHQLAAAVGWLAGSPMLGLVLTALAALVTIWIVLITLLRQLPARAALLSAATLAVLLLCQHYWLKVELHGAELQENFFFSQIAGQALMLLALLGALRLERAGWPAWWRHALLLAAIYLLCFVHLLPAIELLAALGVVVVLELLRLGGGAERPARTAADWSTLAAPVIGAALVRTHPAYAVMKSISAHDGHLVTHYLPGMPVFGAYALAVLLLSALMLYNWRRIPAPGRAAEALGLKYLGLYGVACAGVCLLQLLMLWAGSGSEYAVKKYVFALHSAALLELSMLPMLLLAWHRNAGTEAERLGGWNRHWATLGWLSGPLLLVLATWGLAANKFLDTPTLVKWERTLLLLRDVQLAPLPNRPTYISGVPGLSNNNAYMFSIGVFHAPRDANANDVLQGRAPRQTARLGHVLTGPATAEAGITACREPGGNAALAIVDGACLDQLKHPAGTHIGLTAGESLRGCELSGFSAPEDNGSWTIATQISISCDVPAVNGRAATAVTVEASAFLDHIAFQRVDASVDGGAPLPFRYDGKTPTQSLRLPLPASAKVGDRVVLRLALPDARSPQVVGLSADNRQLGLMISAVEFH